MPLPGCRSLLTDEQWQQVRQAVATSARNVDREVAVNGRCLVVRGPLDVARSIDTSLGRTGLTTSLNAERARA